ncbi:MAG TPA: SBBP repeat-containing protein, partial [Nakamurella sp.]|nr:SBBP repeat-containing protein [Nakamurella sp.]
TLAYATTGPVGDTANQGGLDVAVTHLGPDGTPGWTAPIANAATQRAFGAAPGADGVVYVGGYTGGDLDGRHSGNDGDDAFVAAVDADGTLLWTTQFGDAAAADRVYAVGADPAGGVYLAGYTKGSVQDGVSNAGDKDVFVARLDASGAIDWIRQVGSAGEDKGFAVTAFDGGVAAAGVAGDAMPGAESAGGGDGFVAAFDASGASRWMRQIGSAESDLFSGVTTGPDGTLVAVGQFGGEVGGHGSGGLDALAVGYHSAGNQAWVSRWGTEGDDQAATVTVDPAGGYLVTGATNGDFAGSVGGFDIFASHLASDGAVSTTRAATARLHATAAGRARVAATTADPPPAPQDGTIQFGTHQDDGVSQFAELNLYAAAAPGRLWITGATFGSTAAAANAGGADVFLTSLTLTGSAPGTSTGTTSTSTGSATGGTTSAGTASESSGPESTAGSQASSGTTVSSTDSATSETSSAAGSVSGSAPSEAGGQGTSSSGAAIVRPGSGGGLSYTGVAAIGLLVLALLLVGTGGLASVLGRRRPGSHTG